MAVVVDGDVAEPGHLAKPGGERWAEDRQINVAVGPFLPEAEAPAYEEAALALIFSSLIY